MLSPAITLDENGCPNDALIGKCLRALAQRGARVSIEGAGTRIYADRNGELKTVAWLDGNPLAALKAAHWLTEIDPGVFILAPAGRAIVRLMKAAPAPSAATLGGPVPGSDADYRSPASPVGPLAWARKHRNKDGQPYLSAQACEAGERLRADFARSGMAARTTVDWDAIARSRDEQRGAHALSRETAPGASAATERVRRAIASVPPELAGLIWDVCCFDHGVEESGRRRGVPQRSGHFVLAVALNALARHYGLLPQPVQPTVGGHRTRHWGSSDYKPTIDGVKRYGD